MKRAIRFFLAGFVAWVVVFGLAAQENDRTDISEGRQRVGIVPMTHPEDTATAERIASSIAETLQLLMVMTGRYDVRILDSDTTEEGAITPEAIAEENDLDGVIYGSVEDVPQGGVRFSLRGYDRFLDEVSADVELEVDSYLASFDAADQIAVALIEGFSGVRLTYGAIELSNIESVSEIAFYINNFPLALSSNRINDIVAGQHRIRIEQERLYGRETLFDETVRVSEGEVVTVGVTIPLLTDREWETLTEIDRDVRAFYQGRQSRSDILGELDSLIATLSDGRELPSSLQQLRRKYEGLAATIANAGSGTARTTERMTLPFSVDTNEGERNESVPAPARVPNAGDILAAVGRSTDHGQIVPARRLSPHFVEYDTNAPWRLDQDGSGALWGSNRSGIVALNLADESARLRTVGDAFPLAGHDNGTVAVDGDNLWIAYAWEGDTTRTRRDGSGVTRWNRRTGEMTHYNARETPNFPPGPVWSVSRSPEGNIWVGTRYGPEAYFDGRNWNSFVVEDYKPSEAFFDVNTISFADGYIYFITWRGGLHRYDPDRRRWEHSEYGKMWEGERRSFFARGLYGSNTVFRPDGTIYLGASANRERTMNAPDGVWHFDGAQWRNITASMPIEGTSIWGIAMDARGRLWGSFEYDQSVKIYSDGRWTTWTPRDLPASPHRRLSIVGIYGDYVVFDQTIGGRDSILVYRMDE